MVSNTISILLLPGIEILCLFSVEILILIKTRQKENNLSHL